MPSFRFYWGPSFLFFFRGSREHPPKPPFWFPPCLAKLGIPIAWYRTKPEFLEFPKYRYGKEQVVGPERPKNVSCSGATPDLHLCNLGVAIEQETILGLSDPRPKRLLAPSLIDFVEIQEFGPCTRQLGFQGFAYPRKCPLSVTWQTLRHERYLPVG